MLDGVVAQFAEQPGGQKLSPVGGTQGLGVRVAEAWESTAALVDGPLSEEFLAELARSVPLQENGRLDPRVLVLTRGNRSVRVYEYLVDCLADGQQPESDRVAGSSTGRPPDFGSGGCRFETCPASNDRKPRDDRR